MAEKPTFASVIKNRGFRYLWINQVLVQLAYNTLNFALIIWVFKLVNSNFAVALLMLSIYLPVILFGMFAGVFVDLADRRKIILVVDFALAIAFLLFIPIKGSYPLILINTFIVNSLAQFFMPSESSSIPLLLDKKQLFIANSLFSLTLYGSFMVGFGLGGPILNAFGLNAVFVIGALELLIAFLFAHNLPSIKVVKANKRPSYLEIEKIVHLTIREVKDTIRFIKKSLPVSASIGLLSAAQGVIGILAVMMPSYLERVLRIHATDASYFLMLPLGFGMVSGAFLVGRIFNSWPRRSLVIPAILAAGVLFILIGFLPSIAQALQSAELPVHLTRPRYFFRAPSLSAFFGLVAFLFGFCTASIIIPSQTVLQENTTEKNRGKIFAALAVIMTSVSAVPVILAGGLSDLFGVTPTLVGLGVLVFLIGLVAFRPSFFFKEGYMPKQVREFLGQGHWEN